MQKRILHILADDKFSDYAIKLFENQDVPSDFVLMVTEGEERLVKLRDKTTIMRRGDEAYQIMLDNVANYEAIILHGMFWRYDYDILMRTNPTTKVAWVSWGGEICGRKEVSQKFLSFRSRVMMDIHNLNRWLKTGKKTDQKGNYELPIDIFRRVDYCIADEQEEYEYAKQYIQAPNLKYLMYNYYTLEDTIGALMDKRCNGNNIFIGNSAASEGNYWDVMPKVARLKQKGQKVIMPLGYGSPWVRNFAVRLGKRLYGTDFMPLIDFMPLDEYNQLVCKCSTMIMPHYAPRAQGNIITALWLGMRVYLSEKCMTYHYFKRIGCSVYSVEKELKRSNPLLYTPMTDEQLQQNRTILRSIYSRESMNAAVQKIVDALVD